MTKVGIAVVALIAASRAVASDGVLEINQACAVQTGCFPGDEAGFPITVMNAGSYRLTGNILASNPSLLVIEVFAPGVSIDLGGFEMRGPLVCQGVPVTCNVASPAVTGVRGHNTRLEVRNGTITGMAVAIDDDPSGDGARFTSLRIEGNYFGILAGDRTIVADNVVMRTAGDGIFAGRGAIVRGNIVSGNRLGVTVAELSHVTENQVDLNETNQISAGPASSILRNTIGAAWNGGTTVGINCGIGCSVFDNLIRNSSRPINLLGGSRYGRNVMTLYALPPSGGTSAGDNQCEGLTC